MLRRVTQAAAVLVACASVPSAEAPEPAAPVDSLPDRLSRTMAGTVGDRSTTIDLQLEEGKVRAWTRPPGPPGDTLDPAPWFKGRVDPMGALSLEEHRGELTAHIEGRLEMEGGQLVLEGTRRPVADDEIQTVRLQALQVPLGAEARLVSRDVLVSDTARAILFYAEAPRVEGDGGGQPAEPALRRLDTALQERVTAARNSFLEAFAAIGRDVARTEEDPRLGPSWYESSYHAWTACGRLLSVETAITVYRGLGAHPNHHTRTLTWDLERGSEVALDDLFRSGSNWLEAISRLAASSLSETMGQRGDPEWIRSGTEPERDNFSAWTAVPEGIRVVFDPYRVAPYAAGPQSAVLPWISLGPILAREGPAPDCLGGWEPPPAGSEGNQRRPTAIPSRSETRFPSLRTGSTSTSPSASRLSCKSPSRRYVTWPFRT